MGRNPKEGKRFLNFPDGNTVHSNPKPWKAVSGSAARNEGLERIIPGLGPCRILVEEIAPRTWFASVVTWNKRYTIIIDPQNPNGHTIEMTPRMGTNMSTTPAAI